MNTLCTLFTLPAMLLMLGVSAHSTPLPKVTHPGFGFLIENQGGCFPQPHPGSSSDYIVKPVYEDCHCRSPYGRVRLGEFRCFGGKWRFQCRENSGWEGCQWQETRELCY